MPPALKRGPGGRFLPRKSAAAARNAAGRTGKRLTIPEQHKKKIAEQDARMSAAMRAVMKKNRRKNSAELLILGNPRKGARRKRLNPDQMQEAIELYEKFHGKAPAEILEMQEAFAMRKEYAALGELLSLMVANGSGKTIELVFKDDGVKVASSPKGTQVYFIGGNQNIGSALGQFEADATKDFVELGECREIVYTTQKEFDRFQTIDYAHEFGEEGGARPTLIYARLAKRLMLAGGDYKVEAPGIIN